ncbi:tetratricopeptide repeat protein [Calditrichota bacterium]
MKRRSETHGLQYFIPLLLLLVVSGCAYYNYLYNAKNFYEAGEEERRRSQEEPSKASKTPGSSNYNKSVESIERMLEYYPNNRWVPEALLLIAKSYYHTERYRPAIRKIEELEQRFPNSEYTKEGLLWKGKSMLKISELDSAMFLFDKMLKIEGEQVNVWKAEAYTALGNHYMQQDLYSDAFEQFKKVVDFQVEDEWYRHNAWLMMGICLDKMGRYGEAVKLYDDILSKKIPRKFRFDSKFNRGVALTNKGEYEVAFEQLDELLGDAAFLQQFPGIELQMAICELGMGETEDARERLLKLTDEEKKGEVAARAFYQLGLIQWAIDSSYIKARMSLKQVSSAGRDAEVNIEADSLLKEIDFLAKSWQKIAFYLGQNALLDSVITGELSVFEDDTIFVDSLQIQLDEAEEAKKQKSSRKGGKRDLDERLSGRFSKRDKDKTQDHKEMHDAEDSLQIANADSIVALDSLTVDDLRHRREVDLTESLFELGGFHLFSRLDADSAEYYIRQSLRGRQSKEIWSKSLATLAHIERKRGNTAAHDSLYTLIAEEAPEGEFRSKARSMLGMKAEVHTDSMEIFLASAENSWRTDMAPQLARQNYLDIVNSADSSSDYRARALLAAAYISWKELKEDSLAMQLYDLVSEQYPGTKFADVANDYMEPSRDRKKKADRELKDAEEEANPKQDMFSGKASRLLNFDEDELDQRDTTVYAAADVDVLPEMKTSPEEMDELIRQFYPLEGQIDSIEGLVEVEFVVTARRRIKDITILSAEPPGYQFDSAGKQIVGELSFKPGKLKGNAVDVRMKQVIKFRINPEQKK